MSRAGSSPVASALQGYMTIDGDTYTAHCPHYTVSVIRTHDPTLPESDEFMIRYALQRHASECQKTCMLDIWNEWFERRRQRFLAEGNERAHG